MERNEFMRSLVRACRGTRCADCTMYSRNAIYDPCDIRAEAERIVKSGEEIKPETVYKIIGKVCVDGCGDTDCANCGCWKDDHCRLRDIFPDDPEPSEDDRKFVKDDAGKPRLSLAYKLHNAQLAIVAVREYGLKKYPNADNWKSVPADVWTEALLRHIAAYLRGEKTDPESGLPHLWHALCNLVYLVETSEKEMGEAR